MKLPKGFLAAGVKCGINKGTKEDLGLIYSHVPAVAAGVFTRNEIKAAPVIVSRQHLYDGRAQAIIANSGCANACTGRQGTKDALLTAELTAGGLKIDTNNVIVASTGVIGHLMPMNLVKAGINKVTAKLQSAETGLDAFARAIMTTDTKTKIVNRQFLLGKTQVMITGVAKGAGMICPDMATMLCFLMTDVKIAVPMLKKALKNTVDASFNMLTVDGDMSTNDTVVVLANGLAGNSIIIEQNQDFYRFNRYLGEVALELAKMIAADGEGATKFVELTVKNALSTKDAKKAALTIANSNLVKTAIFGRDPNWGRIMAALGRSDIKINPEKIDIYLAAGGDSNKLRSRKIKLVNNGSGAGFSENSAKNILKAKNLTITIDLKQGKAEATVFTCDLSCDYVKINADYLT